MWLAILFSRLPFPALYVVSDILFVVAYRVARYRRKLVRKNLTRSFPTKSAREIQAIEKEFYKRLCDYAMETLKLLTVSKEELSARMRFENEGFMEQCARAQQPCFCLSSHQFNWEWVLVLASLISPAPIHFVYQPQTSRFADQLLLRARRHFGAIGIKRSEVGRELIKNRNLTRVVCIVADQFPGHVNDKKYWTSFLHQDTAFFYGVSQLAHTLAYPAFFTRVSRIKRGYYRCRFVKIASPPYSKDNEEIIPAYARTVEQIINEDKPGWLWSHNRWKHTKTRSDT